MNMGDDFSNFTIDLSADVSFSNEWSVPVSDPISTTDGLQISGADNVDVSGSNAFTADVATAGLQDTSVGATIDFNSLLSSSTQTDPLVTNPSSPMRKNPQTTRRS
jgi:hypothetical protein